MILKIVAIVLLFNINFLFAKNPFKTYTSLKLNEQVKVIDDTLKCNGHLYFFFQPAECISCFQHINVIYKTIKKINSNIKVNGFLVGFDKKYTDLFKKQYKIEFPLYSDKLGLYQQLYRINQLPTYIILDRKGRFIAADKCGGTHITLKELVNVFQQLTNNSKSNNIYGFKNLLEIKRFTIIDSLGIPIIADKSITVKYNQTNSKITILNENSSKLIYLDTIGNILLNIDLSKFRTKNFRIRQPLEFSWIKEPDIILYNDLDNKWDYASYIINFLTGNVKQIKYKYPWPPYNISTIEYHRINNNLVAALDRSSFKRNPDTISSNFNTMMFLDTNGSVIKKFGSPNPIFQKHKISKLFSNNDIFIDDAGNIYEIQSPSPYLNIYNKQGYLIKQLEIHYDSTFRKVNFDLDTTGSIQEQWKRWNSHTSYCWDLSVNNETKEIFIIYNNVKYYKDPKNPEARLYNSYRYLHITNIKEQKILGKDIRIPVNSYLIYGKNKLLILLEKIDNKFDIVWYQIK